MNSSSSSFQLPAAKRQRVSSNDYETKNIRPMPSLVVHARNLPDNIIESDIAHSLERYGQINYIVMMHKKRQALIEFNDLNSSTNCINDALRSNILIAGAPAYLNYSSSSKIIRPGDDDKRENHVLLITVINPLYPVSVDTIHSICSTFGNVLRIVIFRKNGVQSMVEFDNVDGARLAKQSLHGADIYAGCCTLKIEFAKPAKLNVLKNDKDSWDYTKDPCSSVGGFTNNIDNLKKQPLLQTPNGVPYPSQNGYNFNQAQQPFDQLPFSQAPFKKYDEESNFIHSANTTYLYSAAAHQQLISANQRMGLTKYPLMFNSGSRELMMTPDMDPYAAHSQHHHNTSNPAEMASSSHNQVVLMVYNLDKLNCDRLFNLFCLYGNVDRIKFLISKESAAMLQMSNPDSLFNVIGYLNNLTIFGRKLQINVSKQAILKPVTKPTSLPDGTPTFKDYCGSRNNRYQTLEAAQKNKPLPPANVLHWFNAPPGITEKQIADVFVNAGAKPPNRVKVFPKKSEKCSTGLAEWNNITESVEALVLANHSEINHPMSKFPYVFKLCFSATPILDAHNRSHARQHDQY